MRCTACATENEPGARFCVECGTGLTGACPACGTPARAGQKFCGECGAALLRTETAAVELRTVSVVFVDLVGYTGLAEARDPEDMRALLSRYFETARVVVGRYGGVVEKFIGDAVMAVWGTPSAREDDAERAVRAALEIVDAVQVVGERCGAPDLRARAGVVTGQVASHANPGEGLVVGDRVNTASRVQSAAQPGTVYADQVTRLASAAAIAYEDLGEHTVKGKLEPLRLWRALRVVGGQGGAADNGWALAPFVGRDPDLRLLKDLYHAAADRSSARLVTVLGAAGIGKSRLRLEFEHYLDGIAADVLWHAGRCLSYGDGVAYWALAEMVRHRLGIAEETPPDEAARRMAAGLEEWVPDAAEREYLAPRLGALLGVSDPGLDRQELFAGWRLFLERLAAHAPVVLTFEDLHWADSGLLDFIEHVLSWSAQAPILILTLARPELADRRPGWAVGRSGVTSIFLEPLDDAAMTELLDGMAGGLPAPALERIVAQAEGVPLYALETVRSLVDRGSLAPGPDGRLELTGDVGELEVPATLTSLLTARLDALPEPERRLVKQLSVFGGRFPRQAAEAVSDLGPEATDALLASLVAKQVLAVRADPLSPDRGQYAFVQSLLRTVAYEMLSRRERKPLHLAAARHLETAFPNQGEEMAEVIAHHLLDAHRAARGDPDEEELRDAALAGSRRAARRAETVGAPEAAERAYRTAAALAVSDEQRIELTQGGGEMALRAGRYEEAITLFSEAASACTATGRSREAARLAGRIGTALRYLGRNEEAIERISAALAVLDPDRLDPDVARLNLELGTATAFAGRAEEAAPALHRALNASEALDLPDVICSAMSSAAVVSHFSGRFEESMGLSEAAVRLAQRRGLNHEAMRAQSNLGESLVTRDRPEAPRVLAEALATAGRLGDRGFESVAAGNLMEVHLLMGRWAQARRLADDLFDEEGDRAEGGYLHYRLAILDSLSGDAAAAERHLRRLEPWGTTEDAEDRRLHDATAGTVALAAGRTQEALALSLPTVRDAVAALGASHFVVRLAWPDALAAALDLDRTPDAAEVLALVDGQPPGRLSPFMHAQRARGRALVAAAIGDQREVETHFGEALSLLEALGYPYWLARVRAEHAAWLIGEGRPEEAEPMLDAAASALAELGAAPALERTTRLRRDAAAAGATGAT